jgi:Fe-Mn family superoxide dismutase
MLKFEEKKFSIPKLIGISENNIEEHLKLYAGYVKHANLIQDHIYELSKDSEKFAYELGELHRRFSFEFGGIKNHEIFFQSLSGQASETDKTSALYNKITATWGSYENFLNRFKVIALTRGIGWAKLVYDKKEEKLLTVWVDEQHLGQLPETQTILALDMWEHSYVADYKPSGKKNYVEDFFKNLNWAVIENNYKASM